MIRAFLLGARGGGGEEVYVRSLADSPPEGVRYATALDAHASVDGARASRVREVLFNRLVHPFLWPLPGLRAYDIGPEVDLVHVHNFPTWLRLSDAQPVVYSVGGSTYAHYLETYLGWSRERVLARYARARRIYLRLGIRSELATPERIDAVVVFSRFAAELLERLGVGGDHVHVIPPGFAIGRPPSRGDDRPFTFLLVGRDPHRKGVDLALAALAALRARGRDVRLHLVGDSSYPAVRAEGVRGWGRVGRERVEELYLRADAVLVPSRAEGYGFAAVEAMGHGLAVIASRRDALPEILGDAGRLIEPDSVDALAEAMDDLARDRDGARTLGARARGRFEERYTRERARARLGALYRTLLGRS